MTVTYEAISSTTLTSNQSSVTLNSFSGYTDLVIVVSATCDAGANSSFLLQLNADSGANYSRTFTYGDGTSAVSGRETNQSNGLSLLSVDPTTRTTNIVYINNYANSTTYKTAISRINNTGNVVAAITGLWRSTAAITSITIYNTAGRNLVTGSTFSVYGIKAE
jgi:hypothetical protein